MTEKKEYYHLTEQFTPVSNMLFATEGNGVYITVRGAIHDLNTLRYANECLEEELQHLYDVVRRYNVSIDIKDRTNNNLHLDNLKLEKENEELKKDNKILLKHCEKHRIIVPMNYERYKEYVNDD